MNSKPSGSSVQAARKGTVDLSSDSVHVEDTRVLVQLHEWCHSQQKGCKNGHAFGEAAAYLFEVPVQHSLHVIVIEGREPSLCHIDWNAIGR